MPELPTPARGALLLALAALLWALLHALLPATLPLWPPFLLGALEAVEPWHLSEAVHLAPAGDALQVWHAYEARVPARPNVRPSMLLPGLALWWALVLAWPGLPPRRRAAEAAAGTALLLLLGLVALVARVHYQYATLEAAPFAPWFGGWRGWSAYLLNRFLVDIGFWVVPLAGFAALRARGGGARAAG